jgi:beta-N-acetylhexosaminidase
LGLNKNRFVDVKAIPRLVGAPENLAIGQRISDDSVTLVRDNRKLLPLTAWATENVVLHQPAEQLRHNLLVVVLCDNVRSEDGRVLGREIQRRRPDATLLYVDPGVAAQQSDDVVKAVDRARAVVAAVYIVPSAARSMRLGRWSKHPASLPDSTGALFDRILARAGERTVVLAMGSPYLADDFPAIQNYICTFSNATVSEVSAVRALFGEIRIHGHMPVNLAHTSAPPSRVAAPAQVVNVKSPQ